MHADASHYEMKVDNAYYSGYKTKEYYIRAEIAPGKKPSPKQAETISQRNTSSLVGKKIIKHSFFFGDYGGAGAGFMGFLLEPGKEWLVVTIKDAAQFHTLLDNKWVESVYTSLDFFKPDHSPWLIYGKNSKIEKDEFTPLIQGAIIKEIRLTETALNITFEKDGQEHLMEILDTDKRLCPYPGPYYEKKKIVYPKALRPAEKMGDYIIFMEDGGDIFLS